ncbi:hypothetical protein HZB02_02400 [Candidatus Woesearchaeota archaeon]|nr:hypothetical protein [Candidatus Woesearchaeota archaeon]
MDQTYLTELARSNLVLIALDRIFEVSMKGSHHPFWCNFSGQYCGLRESEMIRYFENQLMTPLLFKDSSVPQIIETLGQLNGRIANAQKKMERNALEAFIENFLNDWSIGGRLKKQRNTDQQPMEIPSLDAYSFHEGDGTDYVLQRLLPSPGALIASKDVFHLVPYDGGNTRVNMGDQSFSLRYHTSLAELEKSYTRELSKHCSHKQTILINQYQSIAQSLERMITEIEASSVPAENARGEVGWFKEDGNYYLYIVKDNFTLEEEGIVCRFPSCKLGVRLILTGKTISYDSNSSTGATRIFFSRSIKDGKEVGDMQSLKNGVYKHPATTTNGSVPYPYLCVSGTNLPKPSETLSSAACLRTVLSKLHLVIEHGYHGGTVHVYRHLSDSSFEPFKVRP